MMIRSVLMALFCAVLLPFTSRAEEKTIDLNAMIGAALEAGKRELVLEKGTYRVAGQVFLKGIQGGFTFDGGGSVLVFPEATNAFATNSSDNVTLKNFTLDYAVFSFTQGTVIDVDDANCALTIKLHEGYPPIKPNAKTTHLFDGKTRLWKPGAPDLHAKEMEVLADGTVRFNYGKRDFELSSFSAVGDRLAIDWRNTSAFSIRRGCENFRMENVTIWTAPSIAIVGRFTGKGHVYDGVKITRGPKPEGATEDRLLSSCADGLNYAYGNAGPVLKNCDFSFMGDDSVNLHGFTFPIGQVETPDTLLLLRPYQAEEFAELLPENAEARILNAGNYEILGRTTVLDFAAVTPVPELDEELLDKTFPMHAGRKESRRKPDGTSPYDWKDASGTPRYSVYRIRFTQPVQGVELNDTLYVELPALSCSGFEIRDSYFHDHRGRGLRLMATDGVIENNRFERIKQNAISLGAEFGYWREAGWFRNVTIRNNTIRDVCQDFLMTTPYCYAPGAVCTFVRTEKGAPLPAAGHENLLIENNVIDGSRTAGIFLHAVRGAVVRGNTLRNVCTEDNTKTSSEYGLKVTGPITVAETCADVKVENNTVE